MNETWTFSQLCFFILFGFFDIGRILFCKIFQNLWYRLHSKHPFSFLQNTKLFNCLNLFSFINNFLVKIKRKNFSPSVVFIYYIFLILNIPNGKPLTQFSRIFSKNLIWIPNFGGLKKDLLLTIYRKEPNLTRDLIKLNFLKFSETTCFGANIFLAQNIQCPKLDSFRYWFSTKIKISMQSEF